MRRKNWHFIIAGIVFIALATGFFFTLPIVSWSPSIGGFEVIVFTWDWPLKTKIPPIHIWEDGHAVWVGECSDRDICIYESFLSPSELKQIQATISNSGFWTYEEPRYNPPGGSWLTFWERSSGREKSVVVRDSEFVPAVSSLREILDASPRKTEYFPEQGYLFATKTKNYLESGYPISDEDFGFDIIQADRGLLIDGDHLANVWKMIQQGITYINFHETTYRYDLLIPGLSCHFSYNGIRNKWECEIFRRPDFLPSL